MKECCSDDRMSMRVPREPSDVLRSEFTPVSQSASKLSVPKPVKDVQWTKEEVKRLRDGLDMHGRSWVKVWAHVNRAKPIQSVIDYAERLLKTKSSEKGEGNTHLNSSNTSAFASKTADTASRVAEMLEKGKEDEHSTQIQHCASSLDNTDEEDSDDDSDDDSEEMVQIFTCEKCLTAFLYFNEACEHERKCTYIFTEYEKERIGRAISDRRWERSFELLANFKAENGHIRIPVNFRPTSDSFDLYKWVERQKALYRKVKLSEEQVNKLREIGVALEANQNDELSICCSRKSTSNRRQTDSCDDGNQETMNTVRHLCSTTIDEAGRPVQKLTVIGKEFSVCMLSECFCARLISILFMFCLRFIGDHL